ncbi:MAG: hypothetical protein KDB53_17285, partial [Planctomycetes bacterium]|nr:hypothetical protein [Planctomycetota bacterium]
MLRQILKLRQAQRAFREGRYQEALVLADEPEVREHLKARKLRTACLEELGRRAQSLEERGELSLAAADFHRLGERDEGDQFQER